jgi:hypothetical protein
MKEKKSVFGVYLLDVYLEESGWQENERHFLGKLEIESVIGTELDDVDILTALKGFEYNDFSGRRISALITTDRRTVYAEDHYGDGQWWEVGSVKGRVPVYGLKLRGDAA